MSDAMVVPWGAIERALAAGDFEGVLSSLVEGWREARHGAVADVIDLLAAKVTPKRALPKHGPPAIFQRAWMALAAWSDKADLGQLLGTLRHALPTTTPEPTERNARWRERLVALGRYSDDPRTAASLVAVLRKGFLEENLGFVYDPALALLVRIADERVLPMLRELIEMRTHAPALQEYFSRALPPVIAAIEDTLRSRSPLDAEALHHFRGVLERAEPAGSARWLGPHSDLLEMVFTDPSDDGARQVYSDVLLEQGDPRGDFIAIQFKQARGEASDADFRRMRAILRRHEGEWIGDLMQLFSRRMYRRGFLEEATLGRARGDGSFGANAHLDVRLSTIRALGKGIVSEQRYREFAFSPAMRDLREVTVCSQDMLEAICRAKAPWQFSHLVFDFPITRPVLALLGTASSLPSLRELSIPVEAPHARATMALIANWPGRDRVPLLHVIGSCADLHEWLAIVNCIGVRMSMSRAIVRSAATGLDVEIEVQDDLEMPDFLGMLRDVSRLVIRPPPLEDCCSLDNPRTFARALERLAPAHVELPESWIAKMKRGY